MRKQALLGLASAVIKFGKPFDLRLAKHYFKHENADRPYPLVHAVCPLLAHRLDGTFSFPVDLAGAASVPHPGAHARAGLQTGRRHSSFPVSRVPVN